VAATTAARRRVAFTPSGKSGLLSCRKELESRGLCYSPVAAFWWLIKSCDTAPPFQQDDIPPNTLQLSDALTPADFTKAHALM